LLKSSVNEAAFSGLHCPSINAASAIRTTLVYQSIITICIASPLQITLQRDSWSLLIISENPCCCALFYGPD